MRSPRKSKKQRLPHGWVNLAGMFDMFYIDSIDRLSWCTWTFLLMQLLNIATGVEKEPGSCSIRRQSKYGKQSHKCTAARSLKLTNISRPWKMVVGRRSFPPFLGRVSGWVHPILIHFAGSLPSLEKNHPYNILKWSFLLSYWEGLFSGANFQF